jgi:hypothetical protein
MTIRRFDIAESSVVHSFAKAHSGYIKSIKQILAEELYRNSKI